MNRYGWIAVVGVAMVMLPATLAAQTEPYLTPPPGPGGAPASTEAQPSEGPSSMRDTLGDPGLTGRQMNDREFLRTATEAGIADVHLGQLAQEKGSPEVKTFAQQIVADHTAFNKDIATIADRLGVLLPGKMGKEDQAEFNKLVGLSGKDFDKEYLSYIIQSHWKKLHDFYIESSAASDPDLATTVVKSIRVMRDHLGMIEKAAKDEDITLPPRPPRPPRANAAPAAPAAKK